MTPLSTGQITRAELDRCEADPTANLKLAESICRFLTAAPKARAMCRWHAAVTSQTGIMWLVKHHPELKDSQIIKLIGTTKETIAKIRERTHWNIVNISAKHPAMLGLCKQADLDAAITKAGGAAQTEEQVSDISELP